MPRDHTHAWDRNACLNPSVGLEELRRQASRGCRYCQVFVDVANIYQSRWKGLTEAAQSLVLFQFKHSLIESGSMPQIFLQWHSQKTTDEKSPTQIELEFTATKELVQNQAVWISNASCINKVNVARHSSSHQSFEQIKTWLNICDNDHSDCRPSSSHISRPKRLLQISFREDRPWVNLVGGEDEPHARYTALSHCWGGLTSTVFKTFKGTVDDNKEKGVSVSVLSKTFQDAIDITWKLGIRHIWIDSMCIVQCDQKEWEVECTKMGDVYGGAYLVIAASMAENGSVGCYGGQESHLIKFSPSSRDTDTVDLHVKEKVDHKIWRNDEPSWQDWQVSKLPLLSRAWAFQERLLAIRTIHYTPGELVWECRSSVWCECGDLKDGHDSFFKAPGFKIRYARTVRYGSDSERLVLWFALINQYQARELSVPSDRVPALSAIAKQVNSSGVMGTYVCGVWTQWLRQSLFWWSEYDRGTSESRTQRPHKRNPEIPTWSWLSIQGHINTWGRDPNAVVVIKGFEVPGDEVPEDTNASSSYSSAKINLRGLLCMVELTAIDEPAEEINFKIRRAGDEEPGKSARLIPDTIDDFEVPLEELSYSTFYVLRYSPITISFRDQPEYWNCLVLIHSKTEIDVFRRIGIAEIKHDWFRNCVDRDITLV